MKDVKAVRGTMSFEQTQQMMRWSSTGVIDTRNERNIDKPSAECLSHSGFNSQPHENKMGLVALLPLFVWDSNNAFVFETNRTLSTMSL